MFGNVGVGELMLILLVALLVFGPNKLPEVAKNVGKFIRGFQRETSAALNELKEGLGPIKAGVFDEPDVVSSVDPDGAPAAVAAKRSRGTASPARRKTSAKAARPARRPARPVRKPAATRAAVARKPAASRPRTARTSPARASASRPRSPGAGAKATRRKK